MPAFNLGSVPVPQPSLNVSSLWLSNALAFSVFCRTYLGNPDAKSRGADWKTLALSYNWAMHMPYSIQGALFGPVLIGLSLILKLLCPAPVGAGCLTDYLAVPIFFPLIFVYKIVGGHLIMYHELWFVVLYWSLVGLLIGLIFDLRNRRFPYLPEQHPPL